jgi:hypothetical protein
VRYLLRHAEDEAARFRSRLMNAERKPPRAVSPLDKESWLPVAEEWIKLAMSVENRRE